MEPWNVKEYPEKEKWVEALNALVLSIDKWEKIVEGVGDDNGTANCELCKVFYYSAKNYDEHCDGCPVAEKVEARFCDGTPWRDWAHHHGPHQGRYVANFPMRVEEGCEDCVVLAKKELEFLQSLLPEGEKEV